MKNRRFGLPVLLCLVAAAAGLLISYRAGSQSEGGVVMRPFTAQIIEKHFPPNGNLGPLPGAIDYITVARKTNGSQARFLPIQGPDGSYGQLRGIFDVAGKRVSLEPFTESITTYQIPSAHVAHAITASESCPPDAESPTTERSQRLGYEVVRVIETHSSTRGIETNGRWLAPALGCFPLAESLTSPSGSRNETQVVSIMEGEPPDSWFTIPRAYTERSPSQVASAYSARFPGHIFMSDKVAAMADRAYYAHRDGR